MKERKILIAAILAVTIFGVSILPSVQNWWKKDAEVKAEAGVKDVAAPTSVTYDYANFDTEIKNHKVMTITLDNYGTIYKDRNFELGTEQNPFIVLEIVPFEGFAEFGYLVAGSEPLGFDRPEAKYIGSITAANNLARMFNTYVTGSPVWAEEKAGYAEYYSRPTADTNFEGEEYPAGYLASSRVGTVFGKFVKKSNGEYIITGGVEEQNVSVEYVGTGGNYSFEINDAPSYDYIATMQEYSLTKNDLFISEALTLPDWNNVYGYCNGKYGRFEWTGVGLGNYYCEVDRNNKIFEVTEVAGGGYSFVAKTKNPEVPYPGFFGDASVPVYNSEGMQTSTAMIAINAPNDWKITYAYYKGKFGYFLKAQDATSNINLNATGRNCTKITEVEKGKGEYRFVEESGTIIYFDNMQADAAIKFMRDGVQQSESIAVSYALSSADEIYASVKYYRPNEYYYHNEQTDFLTETLIVDESEIADYHIKVLTVTPDVLNEMAERKDWNLIDAADFISFNDANHVTGGLTNWGKYYNKAFFSPTDEELAQIEQIEAGTLKRTFLENDISWAVAVRLLCKISIKEDDEFPNAPLTMPFGCYNLGGGDPYSMAIPMVRRFSDDIKAFTQGTGSINNVTKLYLMLEVFETDEDAYFYNKFIKKEKVVEKETTLTFSDGTEKKVTTGYFDYIVKNTNNKNGASQADLDIAALYWGPYTFLDIENISSAGDLGSNDQSKTLWDKSHMIPIYIADDKGVIINNSVRNNVYIYNNGTQTTMDSGERVLDYVDSVYRTDPFEIIEFSNRTQLSAFDVMYYLLNQERSSLNVLINGSLKNVVYSNVDYESDNAKVALQVGEIVEKEGKLYGRVQFNIKLNSKKGSETDLSNALVQFNIYRNDCFDDPTTMTLENLIPVTQAHLLSELEKPEEERQKTRVMLGRDYYYDVPLELLEGTTKDGVFYAATTEDVKFSAVVCYGLKDQDMTVGTSEDDYNFKKNIYSYVVEQDENGKVTKVVKDNRKTLTFVRRAMFNLD